MRYGGLDVSLSCAFTLSVCQRGFGISGAAGAPAPGAGKLAPYMAMLIRLVKAQFHISVRELAVKREATTKIPFHFAFELEAYKLVF